MCCQATGNICVSRSRAEAMRVCELLQKTGPMLRAAVSDSVEIRTNLRWRIRLLSPLTDIELTASVAEAEFCGKLLFVVFEFAHVAVRLDDSAMELSEC